MGAMAFGNFCSVYSNADYLKKGGVVDCIIKLLKRHQKNEKIAIQCFRALANIALISEDYRKYLLSKGVEDIVRGVGPT